MRVRGNSTIYGFSKSIFFIEEDIGKATYIKEIKMSQILKVDEWEDHSGWRVADVKTWTGWQGMAKVFGTQDLKTFVEILTGKYNARIHSYSHLTDLLNFSFEKYKDAHQLKLDINRIARKQNIQVEKWQRSF